MTAEWRISFSRLPINKNTKFIIIFLIYFLYFIKELCIFALKNI